MSITPDDIADSLPDVDEDDLETDLCEAECFNTFLAKAIRCFAVHNGELSDVAAALNACYKHVRETQYQKAEKIAQKKDEARRFQCRMSDDDWDDWSRRMTA